MGILKISEVVHRRCWECGVLALAALLLASAAWLRGAEYDESYTVFLAMGSARPAWPEGVFTVAQAWGQLAGHSSLGGIAGDLRATDVHPPLYFWISAGWRAVMGTSLFATRGFSVLCGVGGLALVGAIARRLGTPVIPAMLLTLGCYGFVYTGAIARGFALAQLLSLAGVWLLLGARGWRGGLAGGGLLGAAVLANYLAGFVGGAMLLWLLLARRRIAWAALAGFAALLPAALWFFLAQRASRVGQFPPFEFSPALARLAQYAAANLFGGIPLYVGTARAAMAGALAALLLALLALVAWRWRQIPGHWPGRWLLAMAALAPGLGLLGLGLVFNNAPIELRYLAFATPFMGLLLAGGLPRPVVALVLAIQAVSIVGLIARPETMQPQGAAIRAAAALAGRAGVVLIPRGNDAVGLVGAALLSAPAEMRLGLVSPGTDLPALARGHPRVVLALLGVDAASRAVLPAMRAAFSGDGCWREAPGAVNLRVMEHLCAE